jgi:MoxR-like ATPase
MEPMPVQADPETTTERDAARARRGDPTVAAARIDALVRNVEQVIRGKDEVVRLVVTALVARGHVLVEDVPGVGKTTLVETLARSLGGVFHRIQFTSDLLPSDIVGVSLWNPERRAFEFRRGPIFANLVLADEINRATPKTQSALLEAMSEATVTVDDRVHPLPDPFLVLATQNPVDHSGTFPLPDSQLDRFLLRTRMGYPSPDDELAVVRGGGRRRLEDVEPVLSVDDIVALRDAADAVHVDEDLAAYLVAIVSRTRTWDAVIVGASPRASVDLYRAAQARALMHGRDHVVPDDVKHMAVPVLAHRLVLRDARDAGLESGRRVAALLRALVEDVPVPA